MPKKKVRLLFSNTPYKSRDRTYTAGMLSTVELHLAGRSH